ncbi:MAG: DoxX family protein [Proteobacteria bacterium]|nr:DoxX family protein [Pseudomonadota bacterium]
MVRRILAILNAAPYSMPALPLCLAVATAFWNSGLVKLADRQATLALFADEYRLPLLPPTLAAHMAAAVELSMPPLLVLGLLTRPAAFVLLGMTTVIEVFVYPEAWATHIQWAAMLLARGAGALSIDHLIARRCGLGASAAVPSHPSSKGAIYV